MLGSCGIGDVATIGGCFFPLIAAIIFWAITFAGSAALIFIIISGIRFVTSGGDPKKLDQARKTFVYAILGLILVLLSFFIVNFIANITGAVCISDISLSSLPTFDSCH